MKPIKSYLLSLLILGACQTSVDQLPYYDEPTLTPKWLSSKEVGHRIAPFQFLDQNGRVFTSAQLEETIYVANFFFTTCPGICPKMTNNLSLIQRKFSDLKTVQLVSFSVMPWIDTVAQLHAYAEQMDINDQKWHLLTGQAEEIYTLARSSFFAEASAGITKTTSDFLHTENVILVDGFGHIRGVYNGTLALEMERLEEDILNLLKENLNQI